MTLIWPVHFLHSDEVPWNTPNQLTLPLGLLLYCIAVAERGSKLYTPLCDPLIICAKAHHTSITCITNTPDLTRAPLIISRPALNIAELRLPSLPHLTWRLLFTRAYLRTHGLHCPAASNFTSQTELTPWNGRSLPLKTNKYRIISRPDLYTTKLGLLSSPTDQMLPEKCATLPLDTNTAFQP